MDDELLKTFLEIHKTRHFGQAAENLFITQSAVSARMRQLEQEMGVQLFTRERNNIRPTTAGEKLVKYAEDILNTWSRVKTNIVVEDENKIPLTIGAVSSLWDIYLNRWLIKITNINKNIVLNCQVLGADSIHQKINNNTLDFGFTYTVPQETTVTVIKTLPIKFIMVSSDENLNVKNAVRKNYIYVDWGVSFAEVHRQYFQDIPTPLMRIEAGRMAKRFIKSKSGTAYLPEAIVKRDIENKILFKVKDAPEIHHKAYIIYSNSNERIKPIVKKIS
tara:strand:- start:13117 stop:13944 length:828 start_codon:yes stop_codon:yes gene_type:complete